MPESRSRAAQHKYRLFDRGAAALGAVFGTRDIYACPLCGEGYTRAGIETKELTLEHAPPRALGGRGLLLTCVHCNQNAARMDAEAAARQRLLDQIAVLRGRRKGSAGRAYVSMGGATINARVDGTDEYVNLAVDRFNDPCRAEAFVGQLDGHAAAGTGDGESLTLTSRISWNEDLAQVSDLKSAFLVATAALGYSYSSHQNLALVRAQIAEPWRQILAPWIVRLTPQRICDGLYLSKDGAHLLVARRIRAVVLPTPWSPIDSSALAEARTNANRDFVATWRALPWPRTFVAAMDMAKLNRRHVASSGMTDH